MILQSLMTMVMDGEDNDNDDVEKNDNVNDNNGDRRAKFDEFQVWQQEMFLCPGPSVLKIRK